MLIRSWFRRFVRRNTGQIKEDRAMLWKRRFSVAYAFCSINAFILVIYASMTGRADLGSYFGTKTEEEMALPPAKSFAKTLGIKKAEVYRISGFNVTNYTIDENETKQPDFEDDADEL